MSIHLLRSGLLFPAPSGAGWELVGTVVTGLQDNGPNITVNKPTGLSTGDKWFVVLGAYGSHEAVVPGSPWVRHATNNNATARIYVLSRDVDGTEGSSFSVTRSGGSWSNWTYVSFGMRGVDQDGAASANAPLSTTSGTTPTVSAGGPGVILSAFVLANNSVISPPAGGTEVANYPPASRFSICAWLHDQASAGTTTARTATIVSATNWATATVELPLS